MKERVFFKYEYFEVFPLCNDSLTFVCC